MDGIWFSEFGFQATTICTKNFGPPQTVLQQKNFASKMPRKDWKLDFLFYTTYIFRPFVCCTSKMLYIKTLRIFVHWSIVHRGLSSNICWSHYSWKLLIVLLSLFKLLHCKHCLSGSNINTVGIWIPTLSGIWMVEKRLDAKWSGFWMPFEIPTSKSSVFKWSVFRSPL